MADNFGVFGWIDFAQPVVDVVFILSVMLSGYIYPGYAHEITV